MKISRIQILRSLFTTTVLLGLLTSCSSLLYYPSKEELVYRNRMPIKPEDVYFPSEDGAKLHAWYFHSTVADTSDYTILMFHGNAQNLTTHFFTLFTAPSQGYDYLIFDYHGYGESEGKPSPLATVEDGRAALRWLAKKQPGKPIVVFGQSLGGAVALRTVLDMKNEVPVKLVVVDSTFASYRSAGRSVLAHSWITWLFQPLGWLLLSDKEAPEDDLGKLAPTPLIVIHGTKDQTIDFALGQKLYSEASEPKEFWEVPGGRHTDFMFVENGKYATRFYETLEKYCPRKVSK
jgi:uncharacterized protein